MAKKLMHITVQGEKVDPPKRVQVLPQTSVAATTSVLWAASTPWGCSICPQREPVFSRALREMEFGGLNWTWDNRALWLGLHSAWGGDDMSLAGLMRLGVCDTFVTPSQAISSKFLVLNWIPSPPPPSPPVLLGNPSADRRVMQR